MLNKLCYLFVRTFGLRYTNSHPEDCHRMELLSDEFTSRLSVAITAFRNLNGFNDDKKSSKAGSCRPEASVPVTKLSAHVSAQLITKQFSNFHGIASAPTSNSIEYHQYHRQNVPTNDIYRTAMTTRNSELATQIHLTKHSASHHSGISPRFFAVFERSIIRTRKAANYREMDPKALYSKPLSTISTPD
jgi:hypothetical protein